MALVEAPDGMVIDPAALTATSLLRYSAFAETSAERALHDRMVAERRDLIDIDANVILTQRRAGTPIIGDSHQVRTRHRCLHDRGHDRDAAPGDGLSVRTVTAGIGMTIACGLAQRHFPN